MRLQKIKDDNGFNRTYRLRNLSQPISEGIEVTIPDLSKINWVEKRQLLHNLLHDQQLFTADDVKSNEGYNKLGFVINKVFFEPIFKLYMQQNDS